MLNTNAWGTPPSSVRHARDVHELLTEAMHEAPELVNDELRANRDETDTEIRALEQISGRPGSWAAH